MTTVGEISVRPALREDTAMRGAAASTVTPAEPAPLTRPLQGAAQQRLRHDEPPASAHTPTVSPRPYLQPEPRAALHLPSRADLLTGGRASESRTVRVSIGTIEIAATAATAAEPAPAAPTVAASSNGGFGSYAAMRSYDWGAGR